MNDDAFTFNLLIPFGLKGACALLGVGCCDTGRDLGPLNGGIGWMTMGTSGFPLALKRGLSEGFAAVVFVLDALAGGAARGLSLGETVVALSLLLGGGNTLRGTPGAAVCVAVDDGPMLRALAAAASF